MPNSEYKVYCQQCKYTRQDGTATTGLPLPGEPPNTYCDYEKNIISKSFDTWFQNVKDVKHEQKPSEINKNNNCSWFEKQLGFSGIKD